MLAAMFAPGSSRAPGILTDGAFLIVQSNIFQTYQGISHAAEKELCQTTEQFEFRPSEPL